MNTGDVVRTGGCSCGAIRYEIRGEPFHVCHCHCRLCRGVSGAPVVTWMTVPNAAFRLTQGKLTTFASSPMAERGFCADCGTHITFDHGDYADEIDLTVLSLDVPESVPPQSHIWTDNKVSWVDLDRHLAQRRED